MVDGRLLRLPGAMSLLRSMTALQIIQPLNSAMEYSKALYIFLSPQMTYSPYVGPLPCWFTVLAPI